MCRLVDLDELNSMTLRHLLAARLEQEKTWEEPGFESWAAYVARLTRQADPDELKCRPRNSMKPFPTPSWKQISLRSGLTL